MTDSKVLLDSSVWLEYFLTGRKEIKEIIESKRFVLLTSVLSILEVKKKLFFEKYPEKTMQESIDFIKCHSLVKEITEEICELAAKDCFEKKLHMADAIIYRTAKQNNAKLLSFDSDFKKLEDAILFDIHG